jgi:hypothetical protein
MKKVVSTLTAVVFALGLAGAAMAQSVTKDAAKPAAKTDLKVTQSQVAPKTEKPGEVTKPAAKEEVKPGETAKPMTKEAPKAGEKDKGKDVKKTTKPDKKVDKKSDCPTDKSVK